MLVFKSIEHFIWGNGWKLGGGGTTILIGFSLDICRKLIPLTDRDLY